MLLNFTGQMKNNILVIRIDFNGVINFWKVSFRKLSIKSRSNDLNNFTFNYFSSICTNHNKKPSLVKKHKNPDFYQNLFKRSSATDNFRNLLGNLSLSGPIVKQGNSFDHVISIFSCCFHSHASANLLANRSIKKTFKK